MLDGDEFKIFVDETFVIGKCDGRAIPERAIISVWVSPFAANKELSWFKLKVG